MRKNPFLSLSPVLLWMGFAGFLPPSPLGGQVKEVSLEVGGSSVKPPTGVEGDAAQFMVAGVRAMNYDLGGNGFLASFQTGRSLSDGSAGDFLSGSLEGSYWHYFTSAWSVGVEALGFAFDVADPYPYRALGMEGGPLLRFANGHVTATLKGVAGTGWSRTELAPLDDEPEMVLEEDLWRMGATAELLTGSSKVMVGLGVGVHDSPGGTYRSVGARLLLRGFGPVIEFSVDGWDTPMGGETTGGMGFVIPVKGWSLRGFLGRTEPDPLTLSQPGGGAGGVMVGHRVLGADPMALPSPPLHEVLGFEDDGARTRIRVKAPRGTERVELMGDFTLWAPLPMNRDGEVWVLELKVPEGIHHFGFLVDGDWYVPEDAPDAVADEWGRKNATLVIER
jgi:hypothetical protein